MKRHNKQFNAFANWQTFGLGPDSIKYAVFSQISALAPPYVYAGAATLSNGSKVLWAVNGTPTQRLFIYFINVDGTFSHALFANPCTFIGEGCAIGESVYIPARIGASEVVLKISNGGFDAAWSLNRRILKLVTDGVNLYASADGNRLIKFDTDLNVIWAAQYSPTVTINDIAYSNGRIAYIDNAASVVTINALNGAVILAVTVDDYGFSKIALAEDGKIALAGNSGIGRFLSLNSIGGVLFGLSIDFSTFRGIRYFGDNVYLGMRGGNLNLARLSGLTGAIDQIIDRNFGNPLSGSTGPYTIDVHDGDIDISTGANNTLQTYRLPESLNIVDEAIPGVGFIRNTSGLSTNPMIISSFALVASIIDTTPPIIASTVVSLTGINPSSYANGILAEE